VIEITAYDGGYHNPVGVTHMRYDEYSYLWPPRPEISVSPDMLPVFEKRRYVAQLKMNGTCSVIAVSPDKTLTVMTRHKEPHKAWKPTDAAMAAFKKLPGRGWYVFVAELLHSKVPGLRNINYVHDVLVNNGEYLVGIAQEDRQDILHDLFLQGEYHEEENKIVVNPNLWLPVEYEAGFSELFKSLKAPEEEGLVLKDPKARLAICSRAGSNSASQIKCRRPHKNYSF